MTPPSGIIRIILTTLWLTALFSADTAAQNASATIDVTDRAAFTAATTNPTSIGFNGIAPAGLFKGFNPLLVSGVSFSTPISSTFVNVTSSTYYSPHNYATDFIVDSVNSTTGLPNANNKLVISLPAPTHAIALDYGGLGFFGTGLASITLSNGHVFSNTALPTVGQTAFVGFISTDPITTVTVAATNDSWVLNDLTLATPSAPANCGVILGSTGQTFPNTGGVGSVGVITGSNCNLNAVSNNSWIVLLPGAFVCPPGSPGCALSSLGIGTIRFVVASDSGSARAGSIVIGNQSFAISEQGIPQTCTFGVSPSRVAMNSGGGTAYLAVDSLNTTCQWSAVSTASWVAASPSAGTGNGTITLRTSANNTGVARFATVTVGGQSITVTQASTTGTGASACGAVDVTSQVNVQPSGLTLVPFGGWNEYSQTITVTNISGAPIPLPVYIVLVGEPTYYAFPDNSYLLSGGPITTCFSSPGDYLVLPSPQGVGSGATVMPPGQATGASLIWVKQSAFAPIRSSRSSIRVLSGTPNK